ncbi:MAG: carbohydrate ABC transporter permease [Treponema sp.]|nr:carbohydrate ABC transporter permease [Treponema sp.]
MTKKNKAPANPNHQTFWERNEASDGILLKETIKKYIVSIFRAILLFGMCFLILQPILNKLSISFMAEKDLYDTTIIVLPKNFSTLSYKITATIMNYKTSLWNTIWVSTLVSVLQVSTCALVGYGFSRFDFPLKRFWFFCVILVIVIPPQTISTSLFLHFRFFNILGITTLNLRNTMTPYILMSLTCMGLKDGLYIFMIRQYFMGFPFELEEAAYVDGCGPFKTFVRIMVPGAKPILVSCFLFSFVWQWTDSFYTQLFLGKIKLLSVAVSSLADKFAQYMKEVYGYVSVTTGYQNAINATGVMLAILPLIILYLFAQNLFVESLSSTGVKM